MREFYTKPLNMVVSENPVVSTGGPNGWIVSVHEPFAFMSSQYGGDKEVAQLMGISIEDYRKGMQTYGASLCEEHKMMFFPYRCQDECKQALKEFIFPAMVMNKLKKAK